MEAEVVADRPDAARADEPIAKRQELAAVTEVAVRSVAPKQREPVQLRSD